MKNQKLKIFDKLSLNAEKINKIRKNIITKQSSKVNFPMLSFKKFKLKNKKTLLNSKPFRSQIISQNNTRRLLSNTKQPSSNQLLTHNNSFDEPELSLQIKNTSFISPTSSKQTTNYFGKNIFKQTELINNNFENEITIKNKEDWNISPVAHKSPLNSKNISLKESRKDFDKNISTTPNNNIKTIYCNNIDIHYHKKKKINEITVDESEEIKKLKERIKDLLYKNYLLENKNSEKENKIINLKDKVAKLEKCVKNFNENNLNNNNETENNNKLLKKIAELEKNVQNLKNENEILKREIDNKTKVITVLKNNQLKNQTKSSNSVFSFTEEVKIKKDNNAINENENKNKKDTICSYDSKDNEKLQMISLDADKI